MTHEKHAAHSVETVCVHDFEADVNETQTIAQAAEEQLASMEQLRQSADELEKMSRQLKEDLSRFVLREI